MRWSFKRLNWIIPLIVTLTFGFWGIRWGFPLQRAYIDEYVCAFYSMHLFTTGPHPQFFDYPSLFLYTLWAAVAILQWITHRPGLELTSFLDQHSIEPIFIGRTLSVLFALTGVLLLYFAAQQWKSPDRGPGLAIVSGSLLALHPIYVRMSHYAMPDILSITLTAAGLLSWILYEHNQKNEWCYASGLSFGLAAATKYTPGFFVFGFLVWLLLQKRFALAAYFAAMSCLGFFIGSPFHILSWHEFIPRFSHLFQAFIGRDMNIISTGNRYSSAIFFLFDALTYGVLILSALGAWCTRRENVTKSLLWAILGFFLGVGLFAGRAERYFLPVLPIFCLWAAEGLLVLAQKRKGMSFAVGFLVIGLLIRTDISFLISISNPDTRLIALEWIRKNIPPGSRILRFPNTPEFVSSDPYPIRVDWEGKQMNESPTTLLKNYDYVITGHFEKEPSSWENAWGTSAQNIFTAQGPTRHVSFPHHPRVRVWTSNSLGRPKELE